MAVAFRRADEAGELLVSPSGLEAVDRRRSKMNLKAWNLALGIATLAAAPILLGAPQQRATAGSAASTSANGKGGIDETGPYDPVENWFKPGFDRWAEPVLGSIAETPDRIIIVAGREGSGRQGSLAVGPLGDFLKDNPARGRGEIPASDVAGTHHILVLNGSGKVVEEWTQWNSLISFAHSVTIDPYDPQRHVWVVDRDNNQLLKFTNDGKQLVMTVGEKGVTGTDQNHFGSPANIKFLPDGSFFVADGYRNSRVIKFDKNGKFLLEWGHKGTGPGEFNLVHDIAIDARGRVYVADRSNNRVQVFDQGGKFLDEWRGILGPAYLTITKDQFLWVTSASGNRLAKYDLNGKLITYWGTAGQFLGGLTNPHAMDVDSLGNLYVSDSWSNRILKFTPKPNADPARLIPARESTQSARK
jgi:peptidylamidoglycolate lyase